MKIIGLLLLISFQSLAIYNGVPLCKDELPQVNRFQGFFGGCTGTLIGRNVVLTAAHCTTPKNMISGHFNGVKVKFFIRHPKFQYKLNRDPKQGVALEYDLSVLVLEKEVPNITPVSISYVIPEEGERLIFVGARDYHERAYGYTDVITHSPYDITVRNAKQKQVADRGDSGSPVITVDERGRVNIVGIVSTSAGAKDWSSKDRPLSKDYAMGVARLFFADPEDSFWADITKQHHIKVCGINLDCPTVKTFIN